MIDMGLFRKCCSIVTILPQILSLNTLICILPLSLRTSQLNQLNKAIRCTDHLILRRVGWGGESTEVPCMEPYIFKHPKLRFRRKREEKRR